MILRDIYICESEHVVFDIVLSTVHTWRVYLQTYIFICFFRFTRTHKRLHQLRLATPYLFL